MSSSPAKTRWFRLLAGFLMLLFCGLIYAWSVFTAPLEASFGWDRAQTSMTFTICMVFFVVGMMAGGVIIKKTSARVAVVVAAALILVGFVLCSRINTLMGLYISYGVFVGAGVGMANTAVVGTIVKWFPDRSGVANGIMMMGFGIGGLLLSNAAVAMFENIGWRTTFLILGIIFGIVIAACSVAIANPGPDFNIQPKARKAGAAPAYVADLTPAQTAKSAPYWLYALWIALISAGGLMVIGHAASFSTGTIGTTVAFAAIATGILSIFNGLGRVLAGLMFDKLGLATSMTFTGMYMIVGSVCLMMATRMTSIPLMIIGFALVGASYGSAPTTSATYCMYFFGPKNYTANYSIMGTGMIPGSMAGPYLAGVLFMMSGNYNLMLYAALGVGVVAMVVAQIVRPMARVKQSPAVLKANEA